MNLELEGSGWGSGQEGGKSRQTWKASLSFGCWSIATSNLLYSLRGRVCGIVTSLFAYPKTSKASGDFLGGFNIKNRSGDETEQMHTQGILALIRTWVEKNEAGNEDMSTSYKKICSQGMYLQILRHISRVFSPFPHTHL